MKYDNWDKKDPWGETILNLVFYKTIKPEIPEIKIKNYALNDPIDLLLNIKWPAN